MNNLTEWIKDNLLPSSIYSAALALVLPVFVLWSGIRTRYISQGLVPFEVEEGEVSSLFFSYFDQTFVSTLSTIGFWAIVAQIGLLVITVAANTYISIRNALVISTSFFNEPRSYFGMVVQIIAIKTGVTLLSVGVTTLMLAKIIPFALKMIGTHFLGEASIPNMLLSLFWVLILFVCFETIWLVNRLVLRMLVSTSS